VVRDSAVFTNGQSYGLTPLHVFITARWKLIGGPRFTAYG
jgi:hypothetical protein